MGPCQVGDEITLPRPWRNSWPLSLGVARKARPPFLGYSDHVIPPSCMEKWLDIQGFTNFTTAHIVAKCNAVNSLQNPTSAACTRDKTVSVINWDLWPQVRIGAKTDLKPDSFAVLESSFVSPQSDKAHTERHFLTYTCIIFVFLLSVTRDVNTKRT